jgi:DNA-binding CsgD family transcriptional regulator
VPRPAAEPQSRPPATKGKASGTGLIEGAVTDYYLPSSTDTSNPWIQLFTKVRDQYDRGAPMDGNVVFGMASAYTLAQALVAAGKNPTRQDVVNAIQNSGASWKGPEPERGDYALHRNPAGTAGKRDPDAVDVFLSGPPPALCHGGGPSPSSNRSLGSRRACRAGAPQVSRPNRGDMVASVEGTDGLDAAADNAEALNRGRAAHDAWAWAEAVEALTAADSAQQLEPEDLELLGDALFMVGRDGEQYGPWERAHQGHVEAGRPRRAARCAFWIGMQLFMRGEVSRGGGWLARAHRLLEGEEDCPERGYLLLPEMFRKLGSGDLEGAVAAATAAAEAGRRFGDTDLFALATHTHGGFLIDAGRTAEGLRLLDEAMLAVSSGELSPIPTGIIYCGAIVSCQAAFDPRRAREWTQALDAWCEVQPELLAFTGDCHVHRAETMELRGDWDDALHALADAFGRAKRAGNPRVAAHAAYRRGEILRRRGELAGAEEAFIEAARGGHEPQPGLALLRLAQGDTAAAQGSIQRALEESSNSVERAQLLPARVEIALAAGELQSAREGSAELDTIAAERGGEMLTAMAEAARGALELGSGNPRDALPHLRRALAAWQDLGARYELARARLLISRACRELGDEDSARLDLEAARETFGELQAAVELDGRHDTHGLTERELQVLRQLTAGLTNKAIAAELVLSERTVDRHVSNIFAKLRVSSRAAATAYAYEHRLL